MTGRRSTATAGAETPAAAAAPPRRAHEARAHEARSWVRQMRQPRVSFQGEPGAYGEDAVDRYWPAGASALPAHTFTDVLTMVIDGEAECAMLPVWNSSIGEIENAVAALRERELQLASVDVVEVEVRHCLLALPGTSVADVRHVGSHPAALAQCTRLFASRPALAWHVAHDTAGAARELAALRTAAAGPRGERGPGRVGGERWQTEWHRAMEGAAPGELAVIASARAGALYGLQLLLEDVQDDRGNLTRFAVVVSREDRRW